MEMLKWPREHHCPWDELTCSAAAAGGHLELLQWARAHHCPWNAKLANTPQRKDTE